MKLSIALLSAAVAVSAAQPHRHAHQHLHKARRDVTEVDAATEIVYVLNGVAIPEADVEQGLKNGTLVLANNGELSSASSSAPAYTAPSSTSTSTWVAPTTSTWVAPTTSTWVAPTTSSTSVYVAPTTSSVYTPPPSSTSSAAAAYSSAASSGSSWGSGATGVESEFPSGEIDCGTFPSEYGAVAVDWLGLGGWTGIQTPGSDLTAGFTNILTALTGSSCSEGAYCSYACPPGYQKSQWPTTQGSTGQSVGGILCQNGKLQLTNPDLSTSLCMTGATEVTIQVQNTLGQNVAVCRTDYPGTESETIPVNAEPGSTMDLACPNADNYYKWQGSSTSAQYYVNPAGVSVENACQWGSAGNPWGNYAPMNIGVGYSDGAAWLSIFQNSPTTDAKLEFTVEIVGDGVSGTCKYSNGQYCGGANYDQCSSTTGCTVSLTSGTATFVFSE